MSTITVRGLIGSVIATCVLGIGALEVVSQRAPVDLASSAAQGAPQREPGPATVSGSDLEFREEPGPSPAQMTGALQMERQTVVNVDPEVPRGKIQQIVVLRRGWQELESPEK